MDNHCRPSDCYVLSTFGRPNYSVLHAMEPIYLTQLLILLVFYIDDSIDFLKLDLLPFYDHFLYPVFFILLVDNLLVGLLTIIKQEHRIFNLKKNDNVDLPFDANINDSIHGYFQNFLLSFVLAVLSVFLI